MGPAPNTGAYEEKALLAAQTCLSEVETAILAVQTSTQDRLPASYLETILGESEEAASSIQSQFDSIQPPDTATAD
ncbi:MAG: hypothetical protein H0T54_05590 [Geodermatophilaceae bacterium]|nr:hypothetical protein [Geodermatophilaceae bacterium]